MEVLAFVVGVVSIGLAIVAMVLASKWAGEGRQSQEMARHLLAEIDKRVTVMEDKVSENFNQLLTTVTEQISRAYPEQPSTQDMLAAQFAQTFAEKLGPEELMKLFQQFQERPGPQEE